jgi:hypothetical protein
LLWRICSDLKIINVKKFVEVSAKVVEVLKQLEGWKRSME